MISNQIGSCYYFADGLVSSEDTRVVGILRVCLLIAFKSRSFGCFGVRGGVNHNIPIVGGQLYNRLAIAGRSIKTILSSGNDTGKLGSLSVSIKPPSPRYLPVEKTGVSYSSLNKPYPRSSQISVLKDRAVTTPKVYTSV